MNPRAMARGMVMAKLREGKKKIARVAFNITFRLLLIFRSSSLLNDSMAVPSVRSYKPHGDLTGSISDLPESILMQKHQPTSHCYGCGYSQQIVIGSRSSTELMSAVSILSWEEGMLFR
jgi:hypothetical protein